MNVIMRICLCEQTLEDPDTKQTFTLKRGQEYTTSPVREADQTVMVFSQYWVRVPVVWFGGEEALEDQIRRHRGQEDRHTGS